MAKTALLSAGGTGGHLFPAQALAQELRGRGWTIHLATDPRAEKFSDDFPADEIHIVPSATFSGKSPLALGRVGWRLFSGYLKSRSLIAKIKPDVAVGFGGYPTVPPLLAAAHKGIPTVLHEQNAVMGRANTFLAGKVGAVATGFDLRDADENGVDHVVTGNPLRAVAHEAARRAYQAPAKGGDLRLLVFGGSQGAQFFSQITPKALELLTEEERSRIKLTLQAREEDEQQVKHDLRELGVSCEVSPFFADLPKRIAKSHLVISRAGASSVAELALIGRPSILVPLPGSLDDDQGANAAHLEAMGGAQLIRQKNLSAERLSSILRDALNAPTALAKQAERAKKAGVHDASARLADLVEAQGKKAG